MLNIVSMPRESYWVPSLLQFFSLNLYIHDSHEPKIHTCSKKHSHVKKVSMDLGRLVYRHSCFKYSSPKHKKEFNFQQQSLKSSLVGNNSARFGSTYTSWEQHWMKWELKHLFSILCMIYLLVPFAFFLFLKITHSNCFSSLKFIHNIQQPGARSRFFFPRHTCATIICTIITGNSPSILLLVPLVSYIELVGWKGSPQGCRTSDEEDKETARNSFLPPWGSRCQKKFVITTVNITHLALV